MATTNFLNTFVAPRQNVRLIKFLSWINRWFILFGIPGLRSIPWVNRLAGVRGICQIQAVELPPEDLARLKSVSGKGFATFYTPNHPEFFTDWMLDRELSNRFAPDAVFWATHTIVNGMGKMMQRFWLANNLIAQIPGGGGEAAKKHSIDHALEGKGVLLHPEGAVGWHGEYVGHLYAGAVDMACESAKQISARKSVMQSCIAPICWKFMFTEDVTSALEVELGYVERKFRIPASQWTLPNRLEFVLWRLLSEEASKLGCTDEWISQFEELSLADFHKKVLAEAFSILTRCLGDLNAAETFTADIDLIDCDALRIKIADWRIRKVHCEPALLDIAKATLRIAKRLYRMNMQCYLGDMLTQENIAEIIKRIRQDYCFGRPRDLLNRYIPLPAGPRIAYVRAPEPIHIEPGCELQRQRLDLLKTLRSRMQQTLNMINVNSKRSWSNPFVDANRSNLCQPSA